MAGGPSIGAAAAGAQLARASSAGPVEVPAAPGCSSGGYHCPSEASHQPGPCEVLLMPAPSFSLPWYGPPFGQGNALRPARSSDVGRLHYFGAAPCTIKREL